MKRFLVSNEFLREKYPSYSCLPFCYPTSRHRHPQVSQVDTHGHSLLSQLGKCCSYRVAMSFIYLNAAHKKEAKAEPIGGGGSIPSRSTVYLFLPEGRAHRVAGEISSFSTRRTPNFCYLYFPRYDAADDT